MSHPPLSASVNDNHAASASQASPLPRPAWLREPLLHFLLLGAILFGVDHYLVTRVDDPRTIVVGAAVDDEAKQLFKASRGRDPNAEELAALRRVWLDNEVLYREGLILQMDKGDSAIRERVIFKALSVVDANTKLPPVTEEVLRTWFDARRAKYDEPPRFDFQEAVLSGDASEAAIRAFVDTLNAGKPGEAEAGLRVFKGRPRSNVEQSYGPEFAKALESASPQTWQALKSKDGWRAVRLEQVTPAKPAVFEVLRNVVQQDWTDATMAEQRSAAVRGLMGKYKVIFEGDAK
ncbi:peptidylprolyl isomerase [Aquabacterium sp.]|uniref:peptidylprolyl isomerase n=1 Tax=Aquabacterium sp. TaxID=1872578 RepID=UPI002487A0BA|nr:peptidylprolyl isomerase [Aquabacterium sp.]MDI1347663.1 peptidylprolyl isomerase [Aquabacterium sp.]